MEKKSPYKMKRKDEKLKRKAKKDVEGKFNDSNNL